MKFLAFLLLIKEEGACLLSPLTVAPFDPRPVRDE